MSVPVRLTSKDPAWFSGLDLALEEAVTEYSLENTDDWEPLAELSNRTEFNDISVHGDLTIKDGEGLVAPASVYVTLVYGTGDDMIKFRDSYPARVFFHIVDDTEGRVVVDKIVVDNSSFYQ